MLQPTECLIEDEKRHEHQRTGIHQRGQHSSALITVGLGGTGWARLEVHCDQRQKQSEKIGKIVSGFGKQCQRMRPDSGHNQQRDIGQRHGQRDLQNPRRAAGMRVDVHLL